MRTVVFSNERLSKLINAHCTSVWSNVRPRTVIPQGHCAQLGDHGLWPGAGAANITSVFATPEGLVLTAIPGYLDVSSFERELKLALDLRARMFGPGHVLRKNALSIYQAAHRSYTRHPYVPRPPRSSLALAVPNRGTIADWAHAHLSQKPLLELKDITPSYFLFLAERSR